jgi:hypothetical protein
MFNIIVKVQNVLTIYIVKIQFIIELNILFKY